MNLQILNQSIVGLNPDRLTIIASAILQLKRNIELFEASRETHYVKLEEYTRFVYGQVHECIKKYPGDNEKQIFMFLYEEVGNARFHLPQNATLVGLDASANDRKFAFIKSIELVLALFNYYYHFK